MIALRIRPECGYATQAKLYWQIMMATLIVYRSPKRPSKDGNLKHKFKCIGDHTRAVYDWIIQDNSHGDWQLLTPLMFQLNCETTDVNANIDIRQFKWEIWADLTDPAAVKRALGRIMNFKLAWDVPERDVRWKQH